MRLINETIERLEIGLLESPPGQRLLGWYRRLPDRDQSLVWSGGAALLVVLVLGAVVLPSVGFANAQLAAYRRADADFRWLLAQEDAARRAAAALARGGDLQALQNSLASSAQAHRLSLRRYQPIDQSNLRVWLEQVAFEDLVGWIQALATEHQLHVAALSVTPAAGGGRVDVRLDIRV